MLPKELTGTLDVMAWQRDHESDSAQRFPKLKNIDRSAAIPFCDTAQPADFGR
jgi:hypothetical protein